MKREKELPIQEKKIQSLKNHIDLAHNLFVRYHRSEQQIIEYLRFYQVNDSETAIILLKMDPFAYFILSPELRNNPSILIYSVSEMGKRTPNSEENTIKFSEDSNYCPPAASMMEQQGDDWCTFYNYLERIGTRGTRGQLMRLIDRSLRYYQLRHTFPLTVPLPPPTVGELIGRMRKIEKHSNEGNAHSSLH